MLQAWENLSHCLTRFVGRGRVVIKYVLGCVLKKKIDSCLFSLRMLSSERLKSKQLVYYFPEQVRN